MEETLNQKLYQVEDTDKGFYSKDNELKISGRWDKKALNWDNQLLDENIHLNQNKEYDNFIYISKKTALLPNNKIDSFLDIGCGTGLVSEALSPYFNKGTGIDISNNMILEAKKKNIQNMNFYKKSFFDLDKNIDGSFDLIVSRGILVSHYGIKYLSEILGIIFSITKKNGYVIFDFLNKNVMLNNIHLPQNKEYYLDKTIQEYALKSGFSKLAISGKQTDRVLIGILYK
jgi:predicted TPR repeat methyltransferase